MQEKKPPEVFIEEILRPTLKNAGYELMLVKLLAGGRYHTLQITAERTDGKPMTVQDCVTISHEVGTGLESEGISPDTYTLEVCSPEEGRPLVRTEDFKKFAGRMAIVEMRAPVGGKKRFQGRIVRVREREKGSELELSTAKGAVRIPLRGITGAKLTLDDHLISEE